MSLVSSASASASPTSASCATTPYLLPSSLNDIACAVAHQGPDGLPSNTTNLMSGCCKGTPVETYADGCGLYCLSVDQSVADLTACLQKEGINPSWIFCNGNNTATATASPTPSGASKTGSGPSGSGTAAGSSSTPGAASQVMPVMGVSKAGLGMLALLAVSAAAGAML